MSAHNGSANNLPEIEIDMRNTLRTQRDAAWRAKRDSASNERKGGADDFSGLVLQISGRSVQEIDHLIVGLQGLREKLDYDGGRLEREIVNYATFNETVVQLTKIVSDGMAQVNKTSAH
jgi:hypothetical protein